MRQRPQQKVYKPKPITLEQANDNRLFAVYFIALLIILLIFG